MELTKEMLIKECKLVRTAGQYVYDNHISDFGQSKKFPHGWCGVLSRVLGAWLSTQYQSETFYMFAKKSSIIKMNFNHPYLGWV